MAVRPPTDISANDSKKVHVRVEITSGSWTLLLQKYFSVDVPAISWQQVGDIIMHGRWRRLRFIKRKGA